MKYKHFKKIDFWTLITVIPLLIVGLNFAFFGNRYFTDGNIFRQATLVTGVLGIGTWKIQTLIAIYLRKRFAGAMQDNTAGHLRSDIFHFVNDGHRYPDILWIRNYSFPGFFDEYGGVISEH